MEPRLRYLPISHTTIVVRLDPRAGFDLLAYEVVLFLLHEVDGT